VSEAIASCCKNNVEKLADLNICDWGAVSLAGRRKKKIVSLDEMKTSDVEPGEAYMRTKQSIAKLMSDAERQYVAEYTHKATPSSTIQYAPASTGSGVGLQEHIKVQKLSESPGQSSHGNSIGMPF
jgi:hypothetical protein